MRKQTTIIIILRTWEFFTPTNVGVKNSLLESEWRRVFSSLQDSSKYSVRSRQCCSLDGLHLSFYFQVLQSLYQSFDDCTEGANYN